MIELLKVSNGTDDYPGNFTKEEKTIIQRYIKGNILHLFSGKSKIGHIRVDYSCNEATHKTDVFGFLNSVLCASKETFDTVILDPPYNKRFADEYQALGNTFEQFIIFANSEKTTLLFNLLEKLKPTRIIIKSWNYYVPRNYRRFKCFVCYAGGYRKPTFLMICERKQNPLDDYLQEGI